MDSYSDYGDVTNFGNEQNGCTLIVIGLEGVGKTTFINEMCGTNFQTSDSLEGCPVEEKQIGTFELDGFERHINIVDMIGLNYQKPGEWQKQIHGKSQVHGVIFFISAISPRESALFELPRFSEYCTNLGIPILYIYRDGVLRFEPSIQIFYKTNTVNNKFLCYTNLDDVKRKIANTFGNAYELHELLDPIELCKQIKQLTHDERRLREQIVELKKKREIDQASAKQQLKKQEESYEKRLAEQKETYNERLQKQEDTYEKQLKEQKDACEMRLNRQEENHEKQLKEHKDSYRELNNKYQKLSNDFVRIAEENQKAIQKLSDELQQLHHENLRHLLKINGLTEENDRLDEKIQQLNTTKIELNAQLQIVNQERYNLEIAKVQIQREYDELQFSHSKLNEQIGILCMRKDYLIEKITQLLSTLSETAPKIANVEDRQHLRAKARRYDTKNQWMWLPFKADTVVQEYDKLADTIAELITNLGYELHDLKEVDTKVIQLNKSLKVPVLISSDPRLSSDY